MHPFSRRESSIVILRGKSPFLQTDSTVQRQTSFEEIIINYRAKQLRVVPGTPKPLSYYNKKLVPVDTKCSKICQ